MGSIKATARFAGLLYVLFSILSVFGYMVVPARFIVSGDAAATARNITAAPLLYRISIWTSLVGQLLFIFLVLTLYDLFKDVDKRQARLMVVLVCVGVAAEIVNIANRIAPLVLLSGANFLSAFTQPQLESLAMGSLRWGNNLGQLLTVFWGLWLFPFGILTIRSGFLPKILGILLMVAGSGYLVTCSTSIVFPDQLHTVSKLMMPLYFGELPIVFWLLVMGAKVTA
jgi:uncharacterized protein DUF4386